MLGKYITVTLLRREGTLIYPEASLLLCHSPGLIYNGESHAWSCECTRKASNLNCLLLSRSSICSGTVPPFPTVL